MGKAYHEFDATKTPATQIPYDEVLLSGPTGWIALARRKSSSSVLSLFHAIRSWISAAGVGGWLKNSNGRRSRLSCVDGGLCCAAFVENSGRSFPGDRPSKRERPWRGLIFACIAEVAEHLPEDRAKSFVASGQGGSRSSFLRAITPPRRTEHVNEQWQSTAPIFAEHGYHRFGLHPSGDLWGRRRVEWWYRQNILVFCLPGNVLQACAPGRRPL